jgi:hypothetical protein
MAQYLYATGGHTPTPWQLKGLAVGCITFIIARKLIQPATNFLLWLTSLVIIFNTKLSLRLSNGVGIIKVITLLLLVAS